METIKKKRNEWSKKIKMKWKIGNNLFYLLKTVTCWELGFEMHLPPPPEREREDWMKMNVNPREREWKREIGRSWGREGERESLIRDRWLCHASEGWNYTAGYEARLISHVIVAAILAVLLTLPTSLHPGRERERNKINDWKKEEK